MNRRAFFSAIGAVSSAATVAEAAPVSGSEELPAGKLYVIQLGAWESEAGLKRIEKYLDKFRHKFGCDFLVLDPGTSLVGRGEEPVHVGIDAKGRIDVNIDAVADRVLEKLAYRDAAFIKAETERYRKLKTEGTHE